MDYPVQVLNSSFQISVIPADDQSGGILRVVMETSHDSLEELLARKNEFEQYLAAEKANAAAVEKAAAEVE